jgi:hypothetical protein
VVPTVFNSRIGKLRIPVEGVNSLEDALKNYNALGDDGMPACISFLQSMLRLNPSDYYDSDRANAADLGMMPVCVLPQ